MCKIVKNMLLGLLIVLATACAYPVSVGYGYNSYPQYGYGQSYYSPAPNYSYGWRGAGPGFFWQHYNFPRHYGWGHGWGHGYGRHWH